MGSRSWLISLLSGVASCCALLLLMTRRESTIAQKSVQRWISAAPAQRDTSAGTQHMASSGPLVAVIFSGYLKISIPERGATARRFLVEPLAADVLVAGSYNRTTDCGGGPHYECLWEGLQGLEPITWRALSPKLTTQEIGALLNASPHFQTIVKAFQPTRTFHGITNWTPLLGSQRARTLGCARVRLVAPTTPWVRRDAIAHRSLTLCALATLAADMIHQIRDYSLLLDLVERSEATRGQRYERLIFSRLEFVWLASHPPLSFLDPQHVWVPYGSPRMNDRHVVMNRSHAEVWCRRWELFTSDALLTTLPLLSLAHDGPEDLIENLFLTRRITVGEFPGTAYLPCCAADGCALRGGFCYRRATSFCQPTRGVLAKRAWGGVPMCDNATTMAVGKYHVEVTLAAAHTAEMRCARYGYVSSLTAATDRARPPPMQGGKWRCDQSCYWDIDGRTRSAADQRHLYRARVVLGSPLTALAASVLASALPRPLSTPALGASAPSAIPALHAGAMPPAMKSTLSDQCALPYAHRSWAEADTWLSARPGYCSETTTGESGDCSTGDKGSFVPHPSHRGWTWGIIDEYSCVRHCMRHCARCRYVSVSVAAGDCSWYHFCDMDALETRFSHTHVTFAIKRRSTEVRV